MLFRKILFTCLLLCIAAGQVLAQTTPAEEAVKNVITQLFNGMEKGDSALVHSTFAREVTMATVTQDKSGLPMLRRESSIDGFLKAVGSPHTPVWYEEIWNIRVQIDGDFAQVWCDYAFYAGNTFSHCGVDAFHLFREKTGWKIFHLADTRRKTGCDIPREIQEKHR